MLQHIRIPYPFYRPHFKNLRLVFIKFRQNFDIFNKTRTAKIKRLLFVLVTWSMLHVMQLIDIDHYNL